MLQSFKQYCKSNPYVEKVIQTSATFKRSGFMVTERRLWIHFDNFSGAILMKEDWLTGDNKKDLQTAFKAYIKN